MAWPSGWPRTARLYLEQTKKRGTTTTAHQFQSRLPSLLNILCHGIYQYRHHLSRTGLGGEKKVFHTLAVHSSLRHPRHPDLAIQPHFTQPVFTPFRGRFVKLFLLAERPGHAGTGCSIPGWYGPCPSFLATVYNVVLVGE